MVRYSNQSLRRRDKVTDDNNEMLVTLTADIVSAHLSNNVVAVGDVATLIANVHSALKGLSGAATPEAPKLEPAVSIKSSVKPSSVVCLECGMKATILKRHLQTSHGLSPDEYRQKWGLPDSYPLVAPNYAQSRRELAVKIGLGKRTGTRGGGRPKGSGRTSGPKPRT